MHLRFMLPLLAVLGLTLMASGKRGSGDVPLVTVHLEASPTDPPKHKQPVKMADGKQYYFQIMPTLSDRDIAWFSPFLADDGNTMGVAFKLNKRGTDRMTMMTSSPENNGRLLGVNVMALNPKIGGVRKYLQVDRRVTDGVVVIWDGLTNDHLAIFQKKFPHVRDVMEQMGAGNMR